MLYLRQSTTFLPSLIVSVTQLFLLFPLDLPLTRGEEAEDDVMGPLEDDLPTPLDDYAYLGKAARGCSKASMSERTWQISWMESSRVQPLW